MQKMAYRIKLIPLLPCRNRKQPKSTSDRWNLHGTLPFRKLDEKAQMTKVVIAVTINKNTLFSVAFINVDHALISRDSRVNLTLHPRSNPPPTVLILRVKTIQFQLSEIVLLVFVVKRIKPTNVDHNPVAVLSFHGTHLPLPLIAGNSLEVDERVAASHLAAPKIG